MVIQKRLFQITVIVILFSILLILALFQAAKGAHFHELHFLHTKYSAELKAKLPKDAESHVFDTEVLYPILTNIKAQPSSCLNLINHFDQAIMRLINTDNAIQLCKDDLTIADETINALKRYENNEISGEAFHMILDNAAEVFLDNSTKFSKPISQTVDFIVASTLIVTSVLSLLMILSTVYAVRGISKSFKEMHETAVALEESEKLNRLLAHFDSLTNLPNRNLFIDRLNHQLKIAKRRNSCMALLFIDLDRFKYVNDTLGHHAGDELICSASERLTSCMRQSDTIARIGGDEFNIILTEINCEKDTVVVCNKILDKLAQPFNISGQKVFISGSIGVSIYPNDSEDADSLQKYADLAMYQAKEKGRNTFEFYSKELDQQVNAKLEMEKHLRHALERNEFQLHFQPVVRLRDLQTVGAEALLRWEQTELGNISPIDFIPLAEETGLIIEIGEWVLREACKNASVWHKESGGNFKVAVNVSPRQLLSENFVRIVKNALKESNLPPTALDIEITESLMVEDDSVSLSALDELSKMGINLLLDDFGTGHSSLSYLHRLPFNVLKVDRSFVMKLDEASDQKNVVPSIVAMAHELNLTVIAEGVETPKGLKILQDLNCEYAQGYFFSRPVPAYEIDSGKNYGSQEETLSAQQ